MNLSAIEKTELNKILALAAEFAVLEGGKTKLMQSQPSFALGEVKKRLKITQECRTLLFTHGISKVEYFPPFSDEIERAKKGSALTCGELLQVCALLRSARIAYTGVNAVSDEEIVLTKQLVQNIYFDENLEKDISTKILSDTQVSDYASDKLYSLRREIRLLNERIRARLAEYLSGGEAKYLQDGIVTMRDNRYVLPVRAEYKRNIKGFIHDRSASGATFFIEPEEVLEMNNELRSLAIDEKEEVARILSELSSRAGFIGEELTRDIAFLSELDAAYARAEYGYKLSCVMPEMNANGHIEIQEGRHPLIDRKKVVPVTLSLGKDYRFLLISGPNTGGKTVSLKMVGLFSIMAMCGFFVPAKRAVLSVFDEIYCCVGDAQSIEESLSTFSSHIKNVIEVVENANKNSLVLIDELGGGTDPDEGQALAKAVLSYLLDCGCVGVITTHYTRLKEFAYATDGVENASMQFDANTLQPLYSMHIGSPGASNALSISRRLGLKESILQDAYCSLSEGMQRFENIIIQAEKSRIHAETLAQQYNDLRVEWSEKLALLEKEREKVEKERVKLYSLAKAESRRIIHERVAEVEAILEEMEEIFAKEQLSESDLIKARTLKNKMQDKAFESEQEETLSSQYPTANEKDLKVGMCVLVKSTNQKGIVQKIRMEKKEAEILCGNIRVRSKFSDLALTVDETATPQRKTGKSKAKNTPADNVEVKKSLAIRPAPTLELNVIGKTVHEALPDVAAFIDAAVVGNLEEVRIVHGVGTGKLRAGIHEFLRGHKNVAEFRLGRYGEGETGVTIVKIK